MKQISWQLVMGVAVAFFAMVHSFVNGTAPEAAQGAVVEQKKEDARLEALFAAIRGNNLKKAKELLDSGINPNLPRNTGAWLLWEAVAADETDANPKMVELLLQYGADPNEKFENEYENSWNPLGIACARGNKGAVQLLLEHGAIANVFDRSGTLTLQNREVPPIVYAVKSQKPSVEIISMLLDHGANVNAKDLWGDTPLSMSLLGNEHMDIFMFLIEKGANINGTCGDDKKSVFMKAAVVGNKCAACFLLDKNVNLNTKNKYGDTPLHFVAKAGWVDIATILLKQKADPNAVGKNKETPLHWAVENGHAEILTLLLKSGAQVNVQDTSGETPFFKVVNNYSEMAVERAFGMTIGDKVLSNNALARLLCDHGADINIKNKHGRTPLSEAAYLGYSDMVELLTKMNAPVNTADDFGDTPLHEALCQGHTDIVLKLIENGAIIDAKNKRGDSPLHKSMRTMRGEKHNRPLPLTIEESGYFHESDLFINFSEIKNACAILIDHKADVNLRNNKGNTPLHLIVKTVKKILIPYDLEKITQGEQDAFLKNKGVDISIIDLLLAHGADLSIKNNEGKTPFDLMPELHDRLKKLPAPQQ